ncbi:MAG: CocE/NonD family hydrolase [Gemmatimonas sp.]
MCTVRRSSALLLASFAAALIGGPRPALAKTQGPPVPRPSFDSSEAMIPMRDGVKLHTTIFVPKGSTADLPFVLTRTPYGIHRYSIELLTSYSALAAEGYIFVFQDIRGRYGSEGQFNMNLFPRDKRNSKTTDESTDSYDTIEWLLKNVPHNNGRVGQLGASYDGWLSMMSAIDPHPALKAVMPEAAPASTFLGDDFHHNGAFRLGESFEYVELMEGGKDLTFFPFDKYDVFSWYLGLGSLAHIDERFFKGQRPTWNNFVQHPNYDAFWQREMIVQYLDSVRVPTLTVAGWWDQEDFYGPITIYRALEKHDANHRNYLIVGPWNHGGWDGPSGQTLGNIDFGSETATYYRKNVQAPWFAYWLKDKGTLSLADATVFEAGANAWRSYDSWPPRTGVAPRKLYFRANGALSFDPPAADSGIAFDAYLSDPAHPVPYRSRPILRTYGGRSTWDSWLMDDQRFAQDRPDVVAWETPALTQDVVITGDIAAHLFAATTGTDADWIVKLIDVYPEDDAKLPGHQLMVSNEVFRGRYRTSFEHPKPIVPNHVDEYTIDLHTQDYRFLKGHKIRVQVQSTWFPLIDRNPQTFVPNIYKAKDTDFKAATMRIYRSPRAPSYVELPIAAAIGVP